MTRLLIRLFVKNSDAVQNKKVRQSYGTLGSFTGSAVNLLLFGAKLTVGLISGSLSIVADAVNNLTDMISCLFTFIGFRISGKPADEDHPYGHGRFEYLTGLAVGILILLVGVELFKSSVQKIMHPVPVRFSWWVVLVLFLTIGAKIWLGIFYRSLGKRISSVALSVSAKDSFNDCIVTSAALLSVVVAYFSDLPVDGYLGLLISLWILWMGFCALKETTSPILGQAPDPALVEEIHSRLLAADGVSGVHDLIIHDYGPGRMMASAHAEVSEDADMKKAHEAIDRAERIISEELGVSITIHLDPIHTDDETARYRKALLCDILAELDSRFSLHDFRTREDGESILFVFDLLIPHHYPKEPATIQAEIEKKLCEVNPHYKVMITFDRGTNGN